MVKSMKQETQIARAMNALSHPRRVKLFMLLEKVGTSGIGFDELLRKSGFGITVLRHHLRPMQAAGLVVRRREGVRVVFRLNGRSFRSTVDDISGRLAHVRPAQRSQAQPPPLT